MEGYIGEIRGFAGSFAPQNWMFCQGQLLSIAEYTPLYAIIGTYYGGDGQTTFALPNTASRIVVGTGQGPGLSNYVLGEMIGTESVSLLSSQMPGHTHVPNATFNNTAPAATISLNGVNAAADQPSPAGNYLAQEQNGESIYADPSTSTNLVTLNSGSAKLNSLTVPQPMVEAGIAGASQPHENRQPYLALNYIICLEGIFPSRN